jgi:hypothetical protein
MEDAEDEDDEDFEDESVLVPARTRTVYGELMTFLQIRG